MANAESGITVDDECKLMFLELKEKRAYRFIIYKIDEKMKMVVVEKVGEPALTYEDFAASLPETECRYAIFDYDFVTEENRQKSKIFFVAWSPDASRVRSKMIYESSKERFKREVHGIHVELEATDANEVGLDVIHRLAITASGVDVDDECKLKFLELKEKRTYRFIIYKIDEKKKMVVVEKVGEPALTYEDFAASLPENECRYAIFDYDFVTEEDRQKRKIFFVTWSPDISRVRSKMIYASSKEIFKRELNGIQVELEATDANEVGFDVIQGLAN